MAIITILKIKYNDHKLPAFDYSVQLDDGDFWCMEVVGEFPTYEASLRTALEYRDEEFGGVASIEYHEVDRDGRESVGILYYDAPDEEPAFKVLLSDTRGRQQSYRFYPSYEEALEEALKWEATGRRLTIFDGMPFH
jgi:hypothetical protein